MNLKQKALDLTYKIENNFFLTVVRRSLTMMIPFVLVGGFACAFINLPFIDYGSELFDGALGTLYSIFIFIYNGTFGLFSLALVIVITVSYCIEKNESPDKAAMYVIVALGAYGAQLNIGTSGFNFESLGVKSSFSAIFIALLSCFLYERLKRITTFSLKKYVSGMDVMCANSISSLLPMTFVVGVAVLINLLLHSFFGVKSVHELFSNLSCALFAHVHNRFFSGLLYTFLLHFFWSLGFHGSNLMEPIAQSIFSDVAADTVFSKSFFDTYIVMGGCGTTICVLLLLLLFFRKTRLGNLSKIAFFPVVFNLNEVLTFGIPIVLNPVMVIPFISTPVVLYCIAYAATASGLVPGLITTVPWSTPILISGYIATGSVRGVLLQLFLVATGMAVYYPFIRLNKRVQEVSAHKRLDTLVEALKRCEQETEPPQFLSRIDSLGMISRVLLDDLKDAIKDDTLFMLYQPQFDADGRCIGAEALLRWNHSLYGWIYPPLIIYLAKEGGVLQQLEEKIIDMVARSISRTAGRYDGDFKISFNITGKSLLWDIESCIDNALKKYSIPAERMWIEITEQDVISKSDEVVGTLRRLKAKGHTLLIDDFGMGHTSLLYLQSGFFGVVKLDGSLVRNIVHSETNRNIVDSIVALGNKLGIKVIAEFVETQEEVDVLHSLGCCWYQGYLYSKPVSFEQFVSYLCRTNEEPSGT